LLEVKVIAMDWIEEFAVKRNSQRSNCYILETFDFERIRQFAKLLRNGRYAKICKPPKTEYENLLEFNIERNELLNLKTDVKLATDIATSPLSEIDNFLRTTSTVAMIHYVYNEQQAEALSNYLVAWAYDDKLFGLKSTVAVFTADATLFSENVRRLVYCISINPSTPDERKAILKEIATAIKSGAEKIYGRKPALKITDALIQASAGLTLKDVESAALESFYRYRKFDVETFTEYKVKILNNYGLQYVQPKIHFEHVGGYHLLKQYITQRIIVPLQKPEKARYYGVDLPRGIILYGYPGTGKTYFTEAMASELRLPMIKLSPADLFRGIVGESEARVRQITTLIESLSPAVIMIDEIDQLALKRAGVMITDSGVSRRVTNMLLEYLGRRDRKSFLVGCTNFIEQMDTAFIRAGRVDEIILVLPPDREAREEILKLHCTKLRKIPVKDVDFKELSSKTFMWTGAELEKICLDAARIAMANEDKHVTMEHFDEALTDVEVNVREREERIMQMVSQMRKLENVNRGFLRKAIEEFQRKTEKTRIKGMLEALQP